MSEHESIIKSKSTNCYWLGKNLWLVYLFTLSGSKDFTWYYEFSGRLPSEDLLKVDLNLIPAKQCNRNYFLNDNLKQLEFGITPDSMICAASANGKKNTCQV